MPVSEDTRYNYSAKGQARRKRYEEEHPDRYSRSPEYQRERYHRTQDEAGCHSHTAIFYPAIRLIRSLEGAEVVEI